MHWQSQWQPAEPAGRSGWIYLDVEVVQDWEVIWSSAN
jgi:hypothetical protein